MSVKNISNLSDDNALERCDTTWVVLVHVVAKTQLTVAVEAPPINLSVNKIIYINTRMNTISSFIWEIKCACYS